MEDYKGLEFTTNKGIKCIVVKDEDNKNFVIVNMDNYKTMSRCSFGNIEELITTVKNNY